MIPEDLLIIQKEAQKKHPYTESEDLQHGWNQIINLEHSAFKAGGEFGYELAMKNIKKQKVDLIWEMIGSWHDAKELGDDFNEPKFSFQDIEMDLYEWMEKIDPLAKPFDKDIVL